MHSTNHCHRDIKPANILYFDSNSSPWKYGDYGISMYYEKVEGEYFIIGTNKYLPPKLRRN
jgi:serine/threonine protein kinase